MFVVFAEAFDSGEVVFDGVQVWGVRRQEQESGGVAVDQLLGLGTFVEGRVIHNHHMRVVQQGAELGFQPPIEDGRVTRAVKQERGGKMVTDPGGKQRGPRSAVSRGQAVHPLPLLGIRIPPANRRFKATFIDVDKRLAPADIALTQAQIPLSFPPAALGVPQRFFSGLRPSVAGHARYNAGTPQSGEPTLFGSDPAPAPRAPATPPNPGGGDAGAPGAGRPARPGH